jgi:hypothetical protein
MAQVEIRCPSTGEMVPTGMDMDPATFESVLMTDNSLQCPACGEMHIWGTEEAQLAE